MKDDPTITPRVAQHDVENASFVESLIMSVCDPQYFSPDQLIPIHKADVQFQVDRHLLRNMDKIRTLAKIELAAPLLRIVLRQQDRQCEPDLAAVVVPRRI